MKFDPSKGQTVGVRRTLMTLSNTLVSLLTKESFESIRVNELCNVSMIPKSTFYNYFDDKFDLLDYVLKHVEEQIYPEINQIRDHSVLSKDILMRLIDAVEHYEKLLNRILSHNPPERQFCSRLCLHFVDCCYRSLINSTHTEHCELPVELTAKMNAYAIITVFEWAFIQKHRASKEQLISYIMQCAPSGQMGTPANAPVTA